ncbi:MAG: hypothetical protein ABSF82_02770 [Candidatus Bathyarchaeia archaeon]
MKKRRVRQVSKRFIHRLIEHSERWKMERYRALYLAKEGQWWVATDNTTADCFVEEFKTKKAAMRWLQNPRAIGPSLGGPNK